MKKNIKKGIIPLLILCCVVIFIISRKYDSPKYLREKQPLKYALKLAGSNRGELEKVLGYYKNDSLKLEAAKFLIENMPQKQEEHFEPYQENKALNNFDPRSFSYSKLLKYVDSLKIHYRKTFVKRDVQTISSTFLINHIDKVFSRFNICYDKNIFFEYLLPYRIGTEPLEDFSTYLTTHHHEFFDTIKIDTTNVLKSVTAMCKYLEGIITFEKRLLMYPQHYTCRMMDSIKAGDCIQLTNYSLKFLRTLGIPCAFDYTLAWGDYNSSHYWSVAITPNGEFPFGAPYDPPGKMAMYYRPPKVFRKTFSTNYDFLSNRISKRQIIPPPLNKRNYVDVTHKYFNTIDISIPIVNKIPKGHNTAFICVFNNGKWQAVDWGEIDAKNNQIKYTNMVDNLLYCAMFFTENRMQPANDPFFVKNKTIRYFHANQNKKHNTDSLYVYSYWSGDGTQKDKYYTLYYWEDGWQTIETILPYPAWIEKQKRNRYKLNFSGLPQGALLWLGGTTRPFWMENGKQVFSCPSSGSRFNKLN